MAERKTKAKTTPVQEVAADETEVIEPREVSQNQSIVPTLELNPLSIEPTEFNARIAMEEARRKILTDYISRNMKDGEDYGKIHISSNCPNKYSPKNCQIAEHWSKNTLFKPGSEKFCSLFGLRPIFKMDHETMTMIGQPGTIAYVCELTTKSGTVVGEGRGVAGIAEKSWSYNNAVKIAQKRAQIDAVLRSGGLSDFFTQDLDDDVQTPPAGPTAPVQATQPQYRQTTYPAPAKPSGDPARPSGKVTDAQLRLVFVLMKERGVSKEKIESHILHHLNVIGIENMSWSQASQVITMLRKMPAKYAAEPQEDIPTVSLDEPEYGGAEPPAGTVEDEGLSFPPQR